MFTSLVPRVDLLISGGEPPFSLHNMIPPCDPSILEHNPKFKRLYENLTVNLLNPDGSTRVHSADPARAAVAEVSRKTRRHKLP